MKRQLTIIAAMGTLLAGLSFAQAPVQSAPARPNWQNHQNQAHNGQGPMNRRPGAGRQKMFEKLNLTAAQKVRAKSIFTQAREASKPARAQLKQNHEAMTAAVKAGNTAQIAQLSAERGTTMGKLATVRNESMAKFYRELTPQQRETFKAEGFGATSTSASHRGTRGGNARGFRG